MVPNSSFWSPKEGTKPDLLCGRPPGFLIMKDRFMMLICGTIVLGGFLRMFFKNSEVIVLAILSLSGFIIGQLAYHFIEVYPVVYPLLITPSFSLYSYFLPLIVFVAALDVDFYIVKNVFWQVLLTGLISFSASFIIIGYVILKFNGESWNFQSCLLLSITLSITDPLHSVSSLKTLGLSKMYIDMIRGESLIICSVACIFFGIFRVSVEQLTMFTELHIIVGLSLDIFGSIICGYWCARVIQFILTDIFSNTLTNVILCFSMVYMTFYIVEYFGMSGIVALATVGLNLDSLSFKPRMEFIITKFLIMFSTIYHHLIYTFFGIVVGCGEIKYFRFGTVVFVFILFVTMNFVRLLTVILLTPILMHSSYEYSWRWGIVITWSGIKGVFSLLLAPDVYNLTEQKVEAPQLFIFYVQIISLLTMAINSYMMTFSARTLGFCALSLPRQMAMQTVIKHIQEVIQNTMTLHRTEKMLTNVNWTLVEEKAKIEYTLPLMILKRTYFKQHWNTLEFLIVFIGLVDIFCIYFVRLRTGNLFLIQFTVVLGYLRVIRFLPVFKIAIPVLINVADVQVKKHLSLMYNITKGYVKSQEDARLLIKQISGRESIYQKLYEILETNKQEAIKELGLIEHEGRDVVTALKTKQAIRNVIAKALKNLTFLRSRGIIDEHEGIEMNKVLLTKIKALNNFPMAIPPPTPDKYLPNIIWMENKDVLIEFFKERTKLAYFDYGDVICREGEMPQGIYLIISGMASLHSSSPTFGIDSSLRAGKEDRTLFTEYCTSGDVIGELSCLLKREIEYTAICETALQAFFISLEDLYEGFDVFWPSLEYKIWLKLALSTACQYFESSLADEDLTFQKCVMLNHAYVETLSSYNEMTIDNVTMKFVIIVYGSVINSKTEEPYLAPCIIPKTCEQIQGTADVSKLLIIHAAEPTKSDGSTNVMVKTGLRMTKKEYNWKRKDMQDARYQFRKAH
ncbi:sodium/hydrogen exchanger 11 [Sciurus carolinensis]|uniref:sodium/hydrogen exchanger 11 n=1 Tax=Sciurus carolinensis TaxID=30640 RepID=UPI001FB2B579|nr:sodium/hydrogen exchanger 11 [Sciurus carolinensis]